MYCASRWHHRCHCRERRLRYVAVYWAALGKPFTCLYVLCGVSSSKHNEGRKIRRRVIAYAGKPDVGNRPVRFREVEMAFAAIVEQRARALHVAGDAFFWTAARK